MPDHRASPNGQGEVKVNLRDRDVADHLLGFVSRHAVADQHSRNFGQVDRARLRTRNDGICHNVAASLPEEKSQKCRRIKDEHSKSPFGSKVVIAANLLRSVRKKPLHTFPGTGEILRNLLLQISQ